MSERGGVTNMILTSEALGHPRPAASYIDHRPQLLKGIGSDSSVVYCRPSTSVSTETLYSIQQPYTVGSVRTVEISILMTQICSGLNANMPRSFEPAAQEISAALS